MTTNRKQTDYNIIVGRKDGIVYVLDYSFFESDNFKGLTGSQFELLTQEQFDEIKKNYDYDDLWREAVRSKNTESSLADFYQELDLGDDFFIDSSYCDTDYVAEMLAKYSKVDGVDYICTNCIGGGRQFGEEMLANGYWDDLVYPEINSLIEKFEKKSI